MKYFDENIGCLIDHSSSTEKVAEKLLHVIQKARISDAFLQKIIRVHHIKFYSKLFLTFCNLFNPGNHVLRRLLDRPLDPRLRPPAGGLPVRPRRGPLPRLLQEGLPLLVRPGEGGHAARMRAVECFQGRGENDEAKKPSQCIFLLMAITEK